AGFAIVGGGTFGGGVESTPQEPATKRRRGRILFTCGRVAYCALGHGQAVATKTETRAVRAPVRSGKHDGLSNRVRRRRARRDRARRRILGPVGLFDGGAH